METINKSIEILTSGGPWLFVLPIMAFALFVGVVGSWLMGKKWRIFIASGICNTHF